MVITLFVVP